MDVIESKDFFIGPRMGNQQPVELDAVLVEHATPARRLDLLQ